MLLLIIAIAVGFALGIEIHVVVRAVLARLVAPKASASPEVKSDVPPAPPVA